MKVAVVGLGGTGSAALRFLAEAGHEATGFEQFKIGHDRGSSHGESRIIRYLYSDPLYTYLIKDAYRLWRDIEARSGEELLVTTGGIVIGPPDNSEIISTQAALSAEGCDFEVLDADEATERFPDFRFTSNETVVFQRDTGFLRAGACVMANVKLAVDAGARVLDETPVNGISVDGDGIRIDYRGSGELFDRVIISTGPWISRMLPPSDYPLRVTRQYVAYVGGAKANVGKPGRLPAWIDLGSPEMFYGIPHDGRIDGVKIATHQFGPDADPDIKASTIPNELHQRIAEYAAGRFRFEDPRPTLTVPCLYTVAPDEDFILDYAPPQTGLNRSAVVVSGCSGHGFKFTVLLGKMAAGLVEGKPLDTRAAERFRVDRFGRG